MSEPTISYRDFDRATRAEFIGKCHELINVTEQIITGHPDFTEADIGILNLDVPAHVKYENFAKRVSDEHKNVPEDRCKVTQNLQAAVIVYERLNQAREWLGFYETFTDAVKAEDIESFPALDVRGAVSANLYDDATSRALPPCVDTAMGLSGTLFSAVQGRDQYIRLTCG